MKRASLEIRKALLCTALVGVLCFISSAGRADTYVTVDFSVSGSWTTLGSTPPYGLTTSPNLTGDVVIDITPAIPELVGLDWVTGSKTWNLSDVASLTASVSGTVVNSFDLEMGAGNYVVSTN